ncbi:peptidoglycan editing factor PgeF [Clostridium aminobutyricum]|uniref:Purine nucleoside phosphorylase n=1 Tax=Clostridium aminobutyricum TaxID=33953 RepID=A0A939IHD0_CLOAM|nr:peptidoglycan editing factor PgeF [Clostridium aminobutyricum]MBN7771776.1 peptidoglycan editing factor PgeF [Clostridium aminobutyricum]
MLNKYYLPVFEKEEGITAFFSTRAGSSPQSPYYNKKVLEELALENCQLIWPKQVHGAHVEVIKGKAEHNEPIRIPETDGLVTNQPNILLTTVHADCLAVFFYDKNKKAIGLVHAGWRGTVQGIGVNAVRTMEEEYGCKPEDIIAFVSPGISQCCFETGPEVYEQFLEKWDWIDEFSEKRGEKYFLDLKGINKRQLLESGVKSIQVSDYCTCCNLELFCSYRGEHGIKCRLGAGICLKK